MWPLDNVEAIWKGHLHMKVSFFLWELVFDSIIKLKIGLGVQCGNSMPPFHSFLASFWEFIPEWYKRASSWPWRVIKCGREAKIFWFTFIRVSIWSLWLERNAWVSFSKEKSSYKFNSVLFCFVFLNLFYFILFIFWF